MVTGDSREPQELSRCPSHGSAGPSHAALPAAVLGSPVLSGRSAACGTSSGLFHGAAVEAGRQEVGGQSERVQGGGSQPVTAPTKSRAPLQTAHDSPHLA